MSASEDDSTSTGSEPAAVAGTMDYDVEHFERELEDLLDAMKDEEVFHADDSEEEATAAMATSSLQTDAAPESMFEASDEDIGPMQLADAEDREARPAARKRPAAMLDMQMDVPEDARRRLRGKQPASVEQYPVTEVALRVLPALAFNFVGARKRPAAVLKRPARAPKPSERCLALIAAFLWQR